MRGSGQQLLSNATKTLNPKHIERSCAHSDADIIEIDDFNGSVDARISNDSHTSAKLVIEVHSDSEGDVGQDHSLSSRRLARASVPIKRYKPVDRDLESRSSKKRSIMRHYDECFLCDEGGELITCDVCPHVFHLDCVGLKVLPKGFWRCPWHSCSECDKSSSHSEGVLFHCMTCPLTFCFECAPDCYTTANPKWSSCALQKIVVLQNRGMTCPKSYRFFQCNECVVDQRTLGPMPKPKAAPALPKVAATLALPSSATHKASHQSPAKAGEERVNPTFTVFCNISVCSRFFSVSKAGHGRCFTTSAHPFFPGVDSAVSSVSYSVISQGCSQPYHASDRLADTAAATRGSVSLALDSAGAATAARPDGRYADFSCCC